jgi:CcmD family protein
MDAARKAVTSVLWQVTRETSGWQRVTRHCSIGGGSVKNLFSIFVAYGVVWVLFVGYLLSLAVRQNGLRQEIATLKALIEQSGRSQGSESSLRR